MSIQSEIDRIENNIAATYAELEEQGATMPSARNSTNLAATAATTKTVKYIAQTLTAAEKEQARENINAAGHFYGVCSTAASTAAKEVTVDSSFALVTGAQVTVKFTNANSASSAPTLNVNGTGAKPLYRYGTTALSTGTTTTGWYAGSVQLFTYDGTGWVRDYWNNTTYSNVSLGQGYATCSTAAATVAKTAALSSYALTTGGIVAVKFTNDVPAGATLNINSKGAKAIYHKGAAITDGVINAGDTATFIYSTYYHLISVDRPNYTTTVKDYGAKGDGSTDDTTAFQNALAVGGVIEVPAGTYVLSDNIEVKPGSELRMSCGTVLKTSGQVILDSWAKISGGIIRVPYNFTSSAVLIDHNSSSPNFSGFATTPVLRHGRTISDLTILKSASASSDHTLPETTSYIAGNGVEIKSSYPLWNVEIDVNVAGGFDKGIYVHADSSWHHDMLLSGVIEACRIGVYLDNVNNAFIDAIIQPKAAANGTKYAENAIYLKNSKNCAMLKSRLWDWGELETLWTSYNQYQQIAMIGECAGMILNDLGYNSSSMDVRYRIYTDTAKNLETLIVLQEPITKWFKSKDYKPYFNCGELFDKKLVLQEELDEIVDVTRTPNFTNALSTATDTDGSIFNGTGYVKYGKRVNDSNGAVTNANYYGCTGFIPVARASNIYINGAFINSTDNYTGVVFYDSNFARIGAVGAKNLSTNGSYYWTVNYEETDKGFNFSVADTATVNNVRYMRLSFQSEDIGVNPIVSVGNPITYTQTGSLTEGITVKAANVEGLSEILGSYINDVDALLGGG